MDNGKWLSSLSYFSIFFAPVLFPLIVWLVSSDPSVKQNAKSGFLSQLIPLVFVPILLFSFFSSAILSDEVPVLFIILVVLYGVVNLIVFIWNIVKGVKVLAN